MSLTVACGSLALALLAQTLVVTAGSALVAAERVSQKPDPRGSQKALEKSASAEPVPAWYETFAIRRRIIFGRQPIGGDAVLLRVGTSRLTQPDARDVRVVLEHRIPVPFEILEVGPGDSALLRFEVLDPIREHHIYLGSISAGRPRRPRRPPQGGLLLEVLELGDGSCDDVETMRKLQHSSQKRIGFLAPRSISLGIPPLGRVESYLSVYTGLLRVDRAGPHTFETVSDGGSFVFIDGKPVASWPGFHGLGGYASPEERRKHSGTVTLAKGPHAIEYLVATRSGGVHVLGWAPPEDEKPEGSRSAERKAPAGTARTQRTARQEGTAGPEGRAGTGKTGERKTAREEPIQREKLAHKKSAEAITFVQRTRPIPPQAYVQWLPAKLGPVEAREDKPVADLDWRQLSDTGSDAERHDLAEVEFRFAGDMKGRRARRVRWSFGDGQTAEGEEVRHVFLKHGEHQIRVAVDVSAEVTLEATRTVSVRFEEIERSDLDALLERYHAATKGYDLNGLPPDHLSRLVWLRSKDDAWKDDLWRAVEAWYARDLSAVAKGTRRIERLGLERALDLIRRGADEVTARRILGALSKTASVNDDRQEAKVWIAWLDTRALGADATGAAANTQAAAEKVLAETYGGAGMTDAARRAGIFLAEILLRQGREKDAREILERVEVADGFRKFDGDRRLSSGARSLSLDNLIVEKRFDEAREEVERWEWELPADRLMGTLQIQRARLLLAESRPADALRELESVWKLEGAVISREMPRALLVAAEALEAEGKRAEAADRLRRIVKDFPHRPESKEAAELLKKGER